MRVGNSWSRDVAVVMVAAAVAELEVWLSSGPRSALAVLVALASLPLLVRRRFPFAAPMLGAAVVAASPLFVRQTLFDGGAAIPVILVAGWSLGRWNDHPRAWAGLGILYVGFLAVILPAAKTGLGDVVYGSMELVAPWFAGRAMRAREAQLETLELRAVQLEGEREQRRRAALAEERLRLARELHDVTAHSISVMTVQAGGARLLLRQDPARAEEALRRVEETGRRTLAEIRRLPDLVGGTANGSSSSLAAVSSLVNEMRDAGLRVELGVEGAVRPLPAGLDLAAFRVVGGADEHVEARSIGFGIGARALRRRRAPARDRRRWDPHGRDRRRRTRSRRNARARRDLRRRVRGRSAAGWWLSRARATASRTGGRLMRARTGDWLIVVLFVVAVAEICLRVPFWGAAALLPFAPFWTLPLLGRRVHPLPSALAVLASAAISSQVSGGTVSAAMWVGMLASFAVIGLYETDSRRAWLGASVGVALLGVVAVTDQGLSLGLIVGVLLFGGLPVLAGVALRVRASREAELRELTRRLERLQEEEARIAIAEERARIAVELNEVIARAVTGMTVQAGAARLHVQCDPQRAAAAIADAEELGREALAETRRLLGVLRGAEANA